jgi:GTPase
MNEIYSLPPEIEEGNIEYKRQIDGLTPDKIVKFKTQMLWRMNEGRRRTGIEEAVYYIGIDDNGSISGVPIESINESIVNFSGIVKLCNAEIHTTQIHHTEKGIFAIVKIRKLEDYLIEDEIKVGLLGGTNNGKTTFLGILTYDILDDGDGGARSNIFRHNHEKVNGNTSSIKYEIMGYSNEKCINYNSGFISSWEYIVKNSKKIINFIDLPGNSKYIRTTLFGLMAHRPDYILMFISLENIYDETNKIFKMEEDTKQYIDLCSKLNIPFAIILTKKDMIDDKIFPMIIEQVKINIQYETKIIKSKSDIQSINIKSIPLIPISNITGENIELVKELLKTINMSTYEISENKHTSEFMINDVMFIPDVGMVVTGILNEGRIKVGNKLLIGPINKTFYNTEILSLHKKQIPSKYIYKGEIGSIVIKIDNKIDIDKHLVIFSNDQLINFHNKFEIMIAKENYIELKKELQLMIMCRNVYDSIIIENIVEKDNNVILSVKFHNNNIHFLKSNDYVCIRYNNNIIVGNIIV